MPRNPSIPPASSEVEALAARVLFAPLRQREIVDELSRTGRVEAARLAAELGVSTESIRKDLTVLERQGLLKRVHGGAIAREELAELTPEPAGRGTAFAEEKAAIATAALAHVPPRGSILIDAGSTTARLAGLLPDQPLTVATTSLPVALTVANRARITVHSLGGVVRRPSLAGVGHVPLQALAAMNVDVAFLGTSGVSLQRGLTTSDEQEATVKNHMLHAARRRILLVDSSKFGREGLWRHAELRDIDLIITDAGVEPADLEALRRAGPEVEVVATSS